ncbi:hypothetical protein BH11BAC4_BH11BAC4_18020 [soil metagenome]
MYLRKAGILLHHWYQINRLKKTIKILSKSLGILLVIMAILYFIIVAYVSINKKTIIAQVDYEISKKLNGKVIISDVELSFFRDFPNVSVLLHDVSIRDSMYQQHKHSCFEAEDVFIRLNIWKLIKKEPPLTGLRIAKAKIYLYTAEDGYTNKYLFKPKNDIETTKKTDGKNILKSVILEEVSVIIDDKQKGKLHNLLVNELRVKLADEPTRLLFDTKADILIHGLGFNLERGSFVKEKLFRGEFEMKYDKQLNQLQFDSIDIRLSGLRFNISAGFDLQGAAPQFTFRAHAKEIDYETAKSMLTESISKSLAMVSLDKPLAVDANIIGPLRGGDPLIDVKWKVTETVLKTPFFDFDKASFNGFFTNEVVKAEPKKDPNSAIVLEQFTADWHELPLISKRIEIMNLTSPVLSCDLISDFPLTKLNSLINSDVVQLTAGNGSVNVSYNGPLERNSNTNSLINGMVSFKNGNLLYVPRDVQMKNLQGRLIFKNADVLVQNLQCNVLNNAITMQGQAKNLLTLINTEPGKVIIDWNIFSPNLNLGSFVYLLKPGKKNAATASAKKKLNNFSSGIDDVLEKANLHVKLNANSLVYKKFGATNINADISLLEDRYIINNVSMAHAGGTINLNGSLLKEKANYLAAKFKASLSNVDVKTVFNAFNNFGQTGITGDNLEGRLSADIDILLALDENGKPYPSSAQGTINFSLKDGAVNNYEPLKKIQKIIFRKRDFDNIRFAELRDRLDIGNGAININRMEIQSTVFTFFIEGAYSMKGNTDLSIQVPLNNLKKRRADYNLENIGTDKKGGTSIFLRGRPGSDGNVNFKIDLLNKFKKEKASGL